MRPRVLAFALLLTLPLPTWAAPVAEQLLAAASDAEPNLEHGASLFKACVRCHNSDGSGEYDGDVPAIAGQHREVVLRQLIDFHFGKRWDVRMEAITSSHSLSSAQDLADVAGYVSGLPRFADPGRGDGQAIAHGMQLYQSGCASCHGRSGQGDSQKAVPWLAGQHYKYLRREMYYAADNRRPNLADHRALLAHFSGQDYDSVADYLSGLNSSATGR